MFLVSSYNSIIIRSFPVENAINLVSGKRGRNGNHETLQYFALSVVSKVKMANSNDLEFHVKISPSFHALKKKSEQKTG